MEQFTELANKYIILFSVQKKIERLSDPELNLYYKSSALNDYLFQTINVKIFCV